MANGRSFTWFVDPAFHPVRLVDIAFTGLPGRVAAGETLRLNTEAYGGMIDYTWFDRPLALAGRVLVREGDRIESRLLATEREVAIIPSLAIHMNRGVNEAFAPNRAVDLCPVILSRATLML